MRKKKGVSNYLVDELTNECLGICVQCVNVWSGRGRLDGLHASRSDGN